MGQTPGNGVHPQIEASGPLHPRALLAAHGLRPKKRFGQNFLMDGRSALQIAALCVQQPDARVVEIGAGTGALTFALLACGANVTALEIDPDLIGVLRSRDDLRAATIVQADALAFDYAAAANGAPWCAAGNLPYNIATPLLVAWLRAPAPPERIVAMMQRDVVDRLVATPSTPAYGSLTLLANYFTVVRRALSLEPGAFFPRPKVRSSVVELVRRPARAIAVTDEPFFLQVVRGGFAYRRKTLANSLWLALDIERARTQAALGALDIDTEIRAEQLDLGAFGALADRLAP